MVYELDETFDFSLWKTEEEADVENGDIVIKPGDYIMHKPFDLTKIVAEIGKVYDDLRLIPVTPGTEPYVQFGHRTLYISLSKVSEVEDYY